MVASANNLLDAAINYVDLGYRVLPCIPGKKTPLAQHGLKDATTSVEQIERWWTAHPNANVAIATVGLLVVDVDGEGNPWPVDARQAADLARVKALALTPRGGRHYYFRRPAGKAWRCSAGRLAPGVDVRTDGGYVVAPPAVTTEGVYRWVQGQELDVAVEHLTEPPEWLSQLLDEVAARSSAIATGASTNGEGNTIPQGRRNDTLTHLAGVMRARGMTIAEIQAAILQVNHDRCQPPLPIWEVRKIAVSIGSREPNYIQTAIAEGWLDQIRQEALDSDETEHSDPGKFSDDLLQVPGFVAEVARFTLETAAYPEPVTAFAGALMLQALLAGRKVRDELDNRTNLYVISLANSGVGKDQTRKVNASILYEIGQSDSLGTSFASGEGIEDRLVVQPAMLFQVDEFDSLLMRITQARDARYEQMVSIILQMHSSASQVYTPRMKAGGERSEIDQPCLCIFGTAVPRYFYEALSSKLLRNGFLARFVILESRGRGAGQDPGIRAIPRSILNTARWWAEFRPGGHHRLDRLAPRVVQATAEAKSVMLSIRQQTEVEYNQAQEQNDPVAMAVWARAYEHARRLALIYACSACHAEPEITRDAAEWAGRFIEYQARRMLFMIARYASENEFDARRKCLLELLAQWREQHGDEWMPFWKINRKLPWSLREHEDIRNTLIQQKMIEYQERKTSGPPQRLYRLR